MDLKVVAKFFAKNPPSILILLGGIGWLLQSLGLGNFTGYSLFIALGVVLQFIWIAARYGLIPR